MKTKSFNDSVDNGGRQQCYQEQDISYWHEVPNDVLEFILTQQKLTFADYIRICAVFKPWKQAITQREIHLELAPSPPWLMLPPKSQNDVVFRFFDVKHCRIYGFTNMPEPVRGGRCCGSSKGWLVIAKAPELLYLYNPVSRLHLGLPPIQLLPKEQESHSIRQHIGRIELSSSDPQTCTIAAIHSGGSKLAICRASDKTWTFFNQVDASEDTGTCQHKFEDILFSDDGQELKVLCGMEKHCSTIQHDILTLPDNTEISLKLIPNTRTLYWTPLRRMDSTNGFMSVFPYLVKSNNGELLLVERRILIETTWVENERVAPYHESRVKVYKIDEASGELSQVKNLGEQVLFVGRTGSKSFLPWKELEGGEEKERRNLVYFEENMGYPQDPGESFIVPWKSEEEGMLPPFSFPTNLSTIQSVLHWFSPSLS